MRQKYRILFDGKGYAQIRPIVGEAFLSTVAKLDFKALIILIWIKILTFYNQYKESAWLRI